MNIDGAGFVWQKQNKKSFFSQKLQLTSVKNNTNVRFVEVKYGCKVEDHQLKVFIKKNFDQKLIIMKKNR